ncbi:MAG: hypothetical protein V3V05_02700 [Pontiella sp.]
MKNRLIVTILWITNVVFAGNIATKNGAIFQNVTIVSANPERMLIVHDAGACQVEYTELAAGELSPEQRKTIESKLTEHIERKARIEKLQLEKEAFEQAQRKKGLIQFEDSWMKPQERDEMLARREILKLEKERLRLELETQKEQLRKEQLLAEQGDRLLEPPSRNYIIYSSGLSRSRWNNNGYCIQPLPGYKNSRWKNRGSSWSGSSGSIPYGYRSSSGGGLRRR